MEVCDGVRDIIVHHYFDVDADEIYRICLEDIPQFAASDKTNAG